MINRHVNAIAGRLSLRPPQRASLEILDRVTEMVPPKKHADLKAALAAIKSEFSDAAYHVTSRGHARQEIVEDDRDRTHFLTPLAHVIEN